ncbi:GNAT family N-acetyltransferase [Pseudooceanicola nanhaiensis]|uniref:GNAT family N-acetyltransferase n=1 Tax=Pseudooceanicola nanhaiensis TaxID=375761 RepID=UPI001CD7394C|nr:GNAT family N-acetyltransferase [Pseudooceanicola nanhaiensis]MCA0918995.1 GNAT family N-acetyltransferase [Pseudooceanicola nanhaiensis]
MSPLPASLPAGLSLARPADLPRVQEIVEAAYAPWTPLLGQRAGPMDDDYAAFIADGHALIYRPDGREVLGLLVLIPQADALMLDNVALAAEAKGKGHGRILLDAVEQIARAMGRDRIRLYTHEKMAANIAIYAARGYVETARITEKGRNRVYMEKALG